MTVCPNCGADLKEGAKFCSKCGSPVPVEPEVVAEDIVNEIKQETEQTVEETAAEITEETVEAVEETSEAAEEVSAEISTQAEEITEEVNEDAEEIKAEIIESAGQEWADPKKPKFNFKKPEIKLPQGLNLKLIGIIAAAAVVLVLAIVLICNAGGKGGSMLDAAFYIKDGQLQYSEFNKKAAYEVTSKLCDDWESDDFAQYASEIGYFCVVTDDGKTLFFPDKIDEKDDGITLYSRTLGSKKEAVKIASDVTGYRVADKGNVVFYTKDDTLHRVIVNKEDDEKICSDVSSFEVSEDGKSAIIKDADSKYYLWTLKGEKEKIDSDIDAVYYTDDFTTVVYRKDDTVYRWTSKDGKEKLVKNVERIYAFDSEKCSFYFTVFDENVLKNGDVYKGSKDDNSFESLKDKEYMKLYSLYYFNGKDSELLTESFLPLDRGIGSYSYNAYAFGMKAAVFYSVDVDSIDKVSLDKVRSSEDGDALLQDAVASGAKYSVAVGGKVTDLNIEEGYNFIIAPDGSAIYYLSEISEKKAEAELYKIKLNGSKVSAPELYDDEVSCDKSSYACYIYFADDSSVAYYKDVKDGEGEFYINKKLVSDEVKRDRYFLTDAGTIFVMTDFNSKKNEGTLCMWDGKKLTDVTDEAQESLYRVLPGGEVLYLSDYSEKHFEGDLYYWDGKSVKLDEDVCAIIPVWTVSSYFE